jgi:cell wall-associated NlpC family hydrolase
MQLIPSYFRKCDGRCAFPLSAISLPPEEVVALLSKIEGIRILNDNYTTHSLISECLPSFARSFIGVSKYKITALPTDAPYLVNCSSFLKYVYSQMGICLPRLAIQQSEVGQLVSRDDLVVGDLVFLTGHINRYRNDPAQSVGHVAMVVGPSQYIHARVGGVALASEKQLYKKAEFRLARRYIQPTDHAILLSCVPKLPIETADDIYWMLTKYL